MKQTIEERTAETILQQSDEITIGDKKYKIAPPSVATLILVSDLVSHLPSVHLDDKKVVEESLSIAKDCKLLGHIAATLILGAKHINDIVEVHQIEKKRHLWGLFHIKHTTITQKTYREQLSEELLEDITPRELHNIIVQTLTRMQIGDFFGLTTFLTEINLTRPTKVVTEATASGR